LRLCLKLRQRQAFGIHLLRDEFSKASCLEEGGLWRARVERGLAFLAG